MVYSRTNVNKTTREEGKEVITNKMVLALVKTVQWQDKFNLNFCIPFMPQLKGGEKR